ncbi:MAG: chemotaxis protein [Magnetospirillum sp.]|nr:MAG: chemotaxis protein [Magnetospirillum sp.]
MSWIFASRRAIPVPMDTGACSLGDGGMEPMAAIEAAIDLVMAGRYGAVPDGDDPVSRKIKALSGRLEAEAKATLKLDVDLSVNINEAVTTAAGMMRDVREVDLRSQAIAAAAEELVCSVAEISRNSDAAAEDARAAQAVAAEGKAAADQAIRSRIETLRLEMGEIVRTMQEGAQAVQKGEDVINATSDGMHRLVDQVRGVSVKMAEIAGILGQQTAASTEVSEGVGVIATLAASNVAAITDVVEEMDDASKAVVATLNGMASLDIPDFTLHVAKSDHMLWRKRLADMVVGREILNPDDLADHAKCRLGKWCGTLQDDSIRKHPAFAALEQPHREVHRHGIEAARRFKAGDLDGALAAIALAAEASKGVMRCLDELGNRKSF